MPDESLEGHVRRICWVDLATVDQGAARLSYCRLFVWTVRDRCAGQGHVSTFANREPPFASGPKGP